MTQKLHHTYLNSTADTLSLEGDESVLCYTRNETDPLICAIKKDSKHPTILKIGTSNLPLDPLLYH